MFNIFKYSFKGISHFVYVSYFDYYLQLPLITVHYKIFCGNFLIKIFYLSFW